MRRKGRQRCPSSGWGSLKRRSLRNETLGNKNVYTERKRGKGFRRSGKKRKFLYATRGLYLYITGPEGRDKGRVGYPHKRSKEGHS